MKLRKIKRREEEEKLGFTIFRHKEKNKKEQREDKKKRDDKRGSIFDLFIWFIVGFIIIVIIFFSIYAMGLLNNVVHKMPDITTPSGYVINSTYVMDITIGQYYNSLAVLRWGTLGIILAMILSILISNYFVKTHTIFAVAYVLFAIVAVLLSAYVSNAYESLLKSPIGYILDDSALNYLYLHLPYFTAVIGIAGAIILFIGINRDQGQGGGIDFVGGSSILQ